MILEILKYIFEDSMSMFEFTGIVVVASIYWRHQITTLQMFMLYIAVSVINTAIQTSIIK